MKIKVNGKEYDVDVEDTSDDRCKVTVEGRSYDVEIGDEEAGGFSDVSAGDTQEKASGDVKAPFPGTITLIAVKNGQKVRKGQLLMILLSMKMENEVHSPVEGVVAEIKAGLNQNVVAGDDLLVIRPAQK